jgi:hypothetical protein
MELAFERATRKHLVNKLLPPGYEYKTYGVAITAETEGDLYEKITGHRSEVLDAAEERRKGRRRAPR